MNDEIKIDFNPSIFNPIYWHYISAFNDTDIRYIFSYGGSSGSKTYSFVQAILADCLETGANTLVIRKYSTDIDDSIFNDFKKIINNWGLDIFFKVQRRIIKCSNGAYIRFRGLDDSEKVKGISSFKRILLEEITQFEFADFKQIRKRLRGMPGQQILATWNPVDEQHWVKTHVLDKEQLIPQPKYISDHTYSDINKKWSNSTGNMVVMHTTYLNNYYIVGHPNGKDGFVDKHTIEDFEYDRVNDYDFYRVYGLGEWGVIEKGGEFYKKFRYEVNVTKPGSINNFRPLHISFDENVNPYMTLTIHQATGNKVYQIDEICLESPLNTLSHTLKEFMDRYPSNGRTIYIYGDRTSKKADVKLQKGQNFFTIIVNTLIDNGYNAITRLPSKNPPVSLRGNFINSAFAKEIEDIEIFIWDNCVNTINDYKYLKEKSDGTKYKQKLKHPVTKVPYEKYGHTSDANDYFYCEFFNRQFIDYQSGKKIKKHLIKLRSKTSRY